MRILALFLLFGVLPGVLAAPVAAQNSLCRVDLSEVSALLTRAQASSAAGDSPLALALVNQADELLAALEARCDLPEVAVTAALGETVTAPAGFSLALPPGWSADTESDFSGTLFIGSTPEAAQAMAAAEPALAPGQAGMLIAYGTPAAITQGTLRAGDLEAVTRYFQIVLGGQYLLSGAPEYVLLDGRPAGQIDFSGTGFEGEIIVVEAAPGLFAAVAAAAPRGELTTLLPVAQAVAASIAPAA